jgi:hypothetical protein
MNEYVFDETFEQKIREYLLNNNSRLLSEIVEPQKKSLERTILIIPKEFVDSARQQNKERTLSMLSDDITFNLGIPYEECYSFLEDIDLNAWEEWNEKFNRQ